MFLDGLLLRRTDDQFIVGPVDGDGMVRVVDEVFEGDFAEGDVVAYQGVSGFAVGQGGCNGSAIRTLRTQLSRPGTAGAMRTILSVK